MGPKGIRAILFLKKKIMLETCGHARSIMRDSDVSRCDLCDERVSASHGKTSRSGSGKRDNTDEQVLRFAKGRKNSSCNSRNKKSFFLVVMCLNCSCSSGFYFNSIVPDTLIPELST